MELTDAQQRVPRGAPRVPGTRLICGTLKVHGRAAKGAAFSVERRAVRALAISAISGLLHEIWEVEKSEPRPEQITRLLDQLDEVGGTSSASGGDSDVGDADRPASKMSA